MRSADAAGWFAVWNKADFSVADAIVAPTYVYYGTPEVHGPGGVREMASGAHTSFPDFHITIEDLIAEGDKVVSRWQVVGTHEGEFRIDGLAIAATGKKVVATGVLISRLADGKIAEEWEFWDQMRVLRQLGATPIPGQAGG